MYHIVILLNYFFGHNMKERLEKQTGITQFSQKKKINKERKGKKQRLCTCPIVVKSKILVEPLDQN